MPSKSICRLCLSVVSNNFETLNACRVGMLQIISLDLNLDVTDKPVVCFQCLEILQQSFFFKTTCLSNEDYLKTFLPCDDNVKLILEEIVQRNVTENIKREQESVCRLCLRYLDSSSFVKLDNIKEDIFLRDMIQKCLPEIELGITNQPLMCHSCMDNLQNQFNFIIACLDNDEKIKSYILANGTETKQQIELNNVLKFVSNVIRDNGTVETDLSYIKLENVSEGYYGMCSDDSIKTEEFEILENDFNVKVEKNFSLETEETIETDRLDDSQQGHKASAGNSPNEYSCSKCSHRTNRKDSLELHYLIHRDLSEVELLKCEKCDFQTKWKSSLTKHLWIHCNPSDIVKFKCAQCPYESKYKRHLRRHCWKHMSVDKKPFRCEYCPWTTGDEHNFKQHNKNKHKKVVTIKNEAFSCTKCHFETKYKSELDAHKKEAHNIVKHVCHCGYTTQKLHHFQQHSLRHKSSDEVVMYSCETCDFQTRYKNSLYCHKRRGCTKNKKCISGT